MAPRPERAAAPRPPPLPIARFSPATRLACLRLIRSENVGPTTFRAVINHFGGAQAALDALPALAARGGRRRPIRLCSVADAEAELEAADAIGARPVFTVEPGYPAALAVVDPPPPLLYLKGSEHLLSNPAVAIVGSRQASAAGQNLARRFASKLGEAGYVIVSGLAAGIDTAVHQASLATGTVAVLAGGIDCIYPLQNVPLANDIAARGCLVTELPPGFQPRGRDFPRRNRIISGLSLGIVVVEAARRSGSLITARMAAEQGREVFAAPGHPLDSRAEGTNQLLKDGATIATEPNDVILGLRTLSGAHITAAAGPYFAETSDPDHLMHGARGTTWHGASGQAGSEGAAIGDGDRSAVIRALSVAPVSIDDVVRATGLPVAIVRMALVELTLAGRIRNHGQQLISLTVGEN